MRIELRSVRLLIAGITLSTFWASNAADASLVGYWTLDESTGTIATDSSGQNITGTIVGTATHVAGIRGNCLQFDGSTYVTIPRTDNNDPIPSWTLAAFVRRTVTNADQGILESYSSSGGNFAMRLTS